MKLLESMKKLQTGVLLDLIKEKEEKLMKLFNVVLVDGINRCASRLRISNRIAVKLIEATDRESAEAEAIRIQQTENLSEHEWHRLSKSYTKSDNGYIIITPPLREGRR